MSDVALDEILDELEVEDPKCARCGRDMATFRQWLHASQQEKWELWLEGYEAQDGPEHCGPCVNQTGPLRDGELAIRDARRFRHLHYKSLLDEGVTDLNDLARLLGITRQGLVRNINTWKKRGWL